MYIRLLEAENVTVTVKQLGAYFSQTEFQIGMEFQEEGLVDTTYNKGISGTQNWILIQGDYTAKGNEKYLIIGNFRTKMKDDFVKKNKWSLFAFQVPVFLRKNFISSHLEFLKKFSLPDLCGYSFDRFINCLTIFCFQGFIHSQKFLFMKLFINQFGINDTISTYL